MTDGQYKAFCDANAAKMRVSRRKLKKEKKFMKFVEKNKVRDIIEKDLTMARYD